MSACVKLDLVRHSRTTFSMPSRTASFTVAVTCLIPSCIGSNELVAMLAEVFSSIESCISLASKQIGPTIYLLQVSHTRSVSTKMIDLKIDVQRTDTHLIRQTMSKNVAAIETENSIAISIFTGSPHPALVIQNHRTVEVDLGPKPRERRNYEEIAAHSLCAITHHPVVPSGLSGVGS